MSGVLELEEKYYVKLNQTKKIINCMVSGTFVPEDAQSFVDDYHKAVNSINPAEYTLEFDCTSMQVVSADMVPHLEACFGLYKESGFNKVIFKVQDNVVLKMQFNRLARNTGLTNIEVTSD